MLTAREVQWLGGKRLSRHLCADSRASAAIVKVDNLLERRICAVVHVRRRESDVAKRWHPERLCMCRLVVHVTPAVVGIEPSVLNCTLLGYTDDLWFRFHEFWRHEAVEERREVARSTPSLAHEDRESAALGASNRGGVTSQSAIESGIQRDQRAHVGGNRDAKPHMRRHSPAASDCGGAVFVGCRPELRHYPIT